MISNPPLLDNDRQVRQEFSDWVYQTVRVHAGSKAVEVEWTVGPIPIDDNNGKEVRPPPPQPQPFF